MVTESARSSGPARLAGAPDASASAAMIRYASGDDQAFVDVYAAVAPRLHRFCTYMVGNAEAGDVMQEVFLKMHRARSSFAIDSSVQAWAYAIARTTCIDRSRRRRVRVEQPAGGLELDAHRARIDQGPESASLGRALEQKIADLLLRLPETLRSAYVLVRVEGMTADEAGAVLGISATAAKDRVHRAGNALKEGLHGTGWR